METSACPGAFGLYTGAIPRRWPDNYDDRRNPRTAKMAERLTLFVNGAAHTFEVDDPNMPLLYALRDELGMNNPRFGCGLGQCGACTVLVDGKAVRSCQMPVSSVTRSKIVTLAGLATPEHPHPLQAAWIEEQVSQCAYCINGWILTAAAFLHDNPHPTDDEIKAALKDLICRCGTHGAALRAVKRAAQSASERG